MRVSFFSSILTAANSLPIFTFHRVLRKVGTHSRIFSISDDLVDLRKETIIAYNTSEFKFREAVRDILYAKWGIVYENFETLHTYPIGRDQYVDSKSNSINRMQYNWNLDRAREGTGNLYDNFDEMYRAFIERVIGPAMGGIDAYMLLEPNQNP
jgi:hypothetical protein